MLVPDGARLVLLYANLSLLPAVFGIRVRSVSATATHTNVLNCST